MYTLRKIIDGIQSNQSIGEEYQFIDREVNYSEFQKTYKVLFEKEHVADLDESSDNFSANCYGFIICNGGSKIIPLYKKQWNYIMTESGNTFSNLTYK